MSQYKADTVLPLQGRGSGNYKCENDKRGGLKDE